MRANSQCGSQLLRDKIRACDRPTTLPRVEVIDTEIALRQVVKRLRRGEQFFARCVLDPRLPIFAQLGIKIGNRALQAALDHLPLIESEKPVRLESKVDFRSKKKRQQRGKRQKLKNAQVRFLFVLLASICSNVQILAASAARWDDGSPATGKGVELKTKQKPQKPPQRVRQC
jgi:hypothetical protein